MMRIGASTALTLSMSNVLAIGGADVALADYNFKTAQYNGPALSVSRGSSAYIDDSAGNWTSVPANTLRRSDKGALIEGAQTNAVRNNSMQNGVAGTPGTAPQFWSTGGNANGITTQIVGFPTVNGVECIRIRYFGTVTATFNSGPHWENVGLTEVSPSTPITTSFFARLVSGSVAGLNFRWHNTINNNANTGVDDNQSSIPLTSTFTRFSLTRTTPATADTYKLTNPGTLFNFPVNAVVDFTIDIGWPQLEQWSTSVTTVGGASSPIRTTGTAATRAADVVTATLPQAVASGMLAGVVNLALDVLRQTPVQLGPSTDRFVLRRNTGGTLAAVEVVGNVGQAVAISAADFTAGARHGFAGAFAPNDLAVSIDGTAPGTSSPASALAAQTELTIGSGLNSLFGYIERLAIYPRRLTNAELQQRSTLAYWGG